MRRRPEEDDQEQEQRLRAKLAGDRRPSQHRRHGAGCAADDDVLRRGRLQQHRVDDRVADEGRERQPHRQRVDVSIEQQQPDAADDAREDECLQRGQLAARQRPRTRARHQRIDLLLDQAVDRCGSAGDQRDADGREEHDPRRRQPGCGEEHADHRAKDDERHHSRFGQREELLQPIFGERERGHSRREVRGALSTFRGVRGAARQALDFSTRGGPGGRLRTTRSGMPSASGRDPSRCP